MEAHRGSRSVYPFIYNLGIIWRLVVDFTLLSRHPMGPNPQYPFNRKLGGFQIGLDALEKRKMYFVCRKLNPGFSSLLPSQYIDCAVITS